MTQSKVITNKHDATLSVQVINDVINTKKILRELNKLDSDDHEMEAHLVSKLNRMWCGSKYSHSILKP